MVRSGVSKEDSYLCSGIIKWKSELRSLAQSSLWYPSWHHLFHLAEVRRQLSIK